MAELEKLMGESLKEEIYKIVEIALNERLRELEKRIKALELLKAEVKELEAELKAEVAEIKKMVLEDKKVSGEKLVEIEALLEKILAKLEKKKK